MYCSSPPPLASRGVPRVIRIFKGVGKKIIPSIALLSGKLFQPAVVRVSVVKFRVLEIFLCLQIRLPYVSVPLRDCGWYLTLLL